MSWRTVWEQAAEFWRSPIPVRVLRLIPTGLVIATLLIGPASHDRTDAPYPLVLLLAAVVVLSNISMLTIHTGETTRLQVAALVALIVCGSALWLALPESVLIILPFWGVRAAIRYRLSGRLELAVVVLGIIGASVPVLLISKSPASAIGTAIGVVALVLAGLNRRSRREQLEELEVSLARKQAAIEEHTRAAALAERARIARDVHDVLAHSLAGLSLSLQGARLVLIRDGASQEAIDQVTRAQGLAAEGLTEARRAVAALRDDSVPDARALADLVMAYRLESGAKATFETSGTERPLPPDTAGTFHRALQEALTNVRKHAPGAPVDVILAFENSQTSLTITDHPGKPPTHPTIGGYGLLGMKERADLIGGTLSAGPTEDGWQTRVTVPT